MTAKRGDAQLKKTIRSNSGAAAIEFAIVAPLLFVLLFGIIEFGAILYNQSVITNASREGARYAATFYTNPANATAVRPSQDEVRNYITSYVQLHLLDFAGASPFSGSNVSFSTSVDATVGHVGTVSIQYTYRFLVLGNLMGLLTVGTWSPNFPLNATTVMRDENQTT
jgi:Flp pilus assembly protein TadG